MTKLIIKLYALVQILTRRERRKLRDELERCRTERVRIMQVHKKRNNQARKDHTHMLAVADRILTETQENNSKYAEKSNTKVNVKENRAAKNLGELPNI